MDANCTNEENPFPFILLPPPHASAAAHTKALIPGVAMTGTQIE